MLTREIAINTANRFISDLKTMGYNPSQAYLFGSVVNNKTHEYSDIDLAVWDKNFSGVMHEDVERLKYLLRRYRTIELHSFTEDTNEENNPFVEIIKQTGLRLSTKNVS